ncbi:GNVR domain-containing protein [Hoeflea sp. AS60]|uniref:GumC family protein n=1 Tax=Hoeflea sp. AS60 TaxID=3135780 RepID=UPI0031738C9E
MSDFIEDRRHRGRRGSLLDHARDAQPGSNEHAREAADGNARPAQPSAGTASSLLATPARSARISTSRSTRRSDSVDESQLESASDAYAAAAARSPKAQPQADNQAQKQSQHQARPLTASSRQEKFGDRIARLIGTIAPDEKPATPQPASQDQEHDPVRAEASRDPRSEAEDFPRFSAEPDQPPFPYDRPRDGSRPHDDHYHWHAASSGGQYEDAARPLLDASILISAVWRFRRLIAATAVAGAVVGVLMALSTPHKYYAESRLFVDPREIRVTEDDVRNQQLSTEAMLAITDSQLQILSSTSVLEKVIVDLGLDRDAEFNGSMSSGGIMGGLSLIKEIFTGKGSASEGEQKALNNLRKALSVGRDAKTFVIIVGVDTRDPEKSALIANQIVETYLDSEGQAQSNLLERTSESIDTRINSLRSDLDAAEREVERFKAENGLVGVGGQYIDDKVILALSDQLANARAMKVGIRVKADNLAKVNINDVLSGAFPEELLSTNLTELRKQYTQTRSNAESLATRLGPRHPQYISALQSLETITKEISAELRRIVASSQTELQRAVATEQELASQMAVAKSRAIDQSVELVTLRELERKANATRGIYEAFLTRSRETSERSNLSTRNVRVISPAEAPLQPTGPSRKIIVIAGLVVGMFAGIGLALLIGAIESIRAYNGAQPQARFPGAPSGGYPEPPAPGPRTPPNGPGNRFWPRRDEASGGGGATTGTARAPYSAARSQAAEAVSDDDPAKVQPIRAHPAVAKSAEPQHAWAETGFDDRDEARSRSFAPSGYEAPQQARPERASVVYPQPQTPQSAPETGRNAQAFMSGNGQSLHQAHPHSIPHQQVLQQPQMQAPVQSQWQPQMQPQSMYQGHPQYQQPPLPAPLFHPLHAVDPYAAFQPSYNPGYFPGPVAAPTAYPVAQPQMMPIQQYPMQYAQQPAFPPQAYPAPQQMAAPAQSHYAAPYAVQPHHPAPVPMAPQPQTVPETHAMPAAETMQPSRSTGNDASVSRIRREMDQLRSRIDGYGSDRRRA